MNVKKKLNNIFNKIMIKNIINLDNLKIKINFLKKHMNA